MSSCSVPEYIDFLGCHLKDQKHTRWTEEYLLCVIKIAAKQIQSDRKDLFKEDKKIKLTPGCKTETCLQGCEDISGPFRNNLSDCDLIDETTIDEDWTAQYFASIKCNDDLDDEDYKVESVKTDAENPCEIIVDPPVPDDGKAYFLYAKCQKDVGEEIASGTLPAAVCKHLNAFTNLVLFYTYGMDSMVNLDPTQSQTYFKNYLDLMGLSYLNDLSFREKNIVLNQLLDKSVKVGAS